MGKPSVGEKVTRPKVPKGGHFSTLFILLFGNSSYWLKVQMTWGQNDKLTWDLLNFKMAFLLSLTWMEGLSVETNSQGWGENFWSATAAGWSCRPLHVQELCSTEREQGKFLWGWSACGPFSCVVHARLRLWGEPKQWLRCGCSSRVHLLVAVDVREVIHPLLG